MKPFTLGLVALALAGSTLQAPIAAAQTSDARCPADEQSDVVAANGIRIAYASYGSCNQQTVLLIGGTGQQLIEWPTELVQALVQRGYRVVAFDNRDVGLSTHMTEAGVPDSAAIGAALQQGTQPPLPYMLRDMAADAIGLLDVLSIRRAHLVGASMGGDIAQFMAIDHPDRVQSLTLIGSDSGNPTQPLIANPDAFAGVPPAPPVDDKDAFVDFQFATYQALRSPAYPTPDPVLRDEVERTVDRACDPVGLVRQQTVTLVDHLLPDGYRHTHLGQISAPTAIVQGADDPLQPLASAQDLANSIPNAELFVIPGLAHDLPPRLADLFVAAMNRVVARAPQP
jgi:pimeloyl-ACP methyl ester carboxylesterase